MTVRNVNAKIAHHSPSHKKNNRLNTRSRKEERIWKGHYHHEQIIAENFPDLGKEKGIEIQEAQRTPFRHNLNRSSARHIIVKLAKYKEKEKILKASKDKRALTYNGRPIRLVTDLSTEIWQARKDWQEILNVMNRKNMQPRILYLASLSFRIEGEIKVFPNKQKLKEFVTTKPALQEILRGKPVRQTTRDISTSIKHTDITMTLNPYLSIITLNVNGLNAPTKINRVSERIKNKTCLFAIYERLISDLRTPSD